MAGNLFDAARMGLRKDVEAPEAPEARAAKGTGAGIVLDARERQLLEGVLGIHPSRLVDLLSDPANLDQVNALIATAEALAPPEREKSSATGILYDPALMAVRTVTRQSRFFRDRYGFAHDAHTGQGYIAQPPASDPGLPAPAWWVRQNPDLAPEPKA